MLTCDACLEHGVDPPSQVADAEAALEADWRLHLRNDEPYRICPDCCEDPWAPTFNQDFIVKAFKLEGRSRRSKEKAELILDCIGWELGGRIHASSSSVLYEGEEEDTGRPIVVKVMRRDLDARPDEMIRFQREVEALQRLEHPNIVRLYHHGVLTNRMYLLMERVGTQTLAELLARGPLPPGRALEIADDLCAALEHVHAAGLIHRDVKPSNIFMAHDGRAKLGDFGLCCNVITSMGFIEPTGTGNAVGTLPFMAPESVSPQKRAPDVRQDVWSTGVVLYELLTGDIVHHFDPPFRFELAPPALQPVLRGALARDHEQRTPTIAALRARLRAAPQFWRARLRRGWRVMKNPRAALRSRPRA